jgi:hypothetical protein
LTIQLPPLPPAMARIQHVVILSGQITVVKDNGECWTLGREGSMPTGALEWQQLPTIPGFDITPESSVP